MLKMSHIFYLVLVVFIGGAVAAQGNDALFMNQPKTASVKDTRLLPYSPFSGLGSVGSRAALALGGAEPQTIQVTAEDGLTLVGDYYLSKLDADESYPAVLLLHMLGSNRGSWSPLTPALLEAGYAVLAVDLRGHGETGGEINWPAATTDVQSWLDWLRGQPAIQPDGISIIGASIGANLALIGCANDPDCVSAIALSPGLDYYGLEPRQAIVGNLSTRSALLVASQIDQYSADSVKALMGSATGDIGARIFAGNPHGTNMFQRDQMGQPLIDMIIAWLNEHTPAKNES